VAGRFLIDPQCRHDGTTPMCGGCCLIMSIPPHLPPVTGEVSDLDAFLRVHEALP
jgi:hypothetical protein